MDAKITKQRLSRLLSYDWLKIVACCVAGILFWSLIFTTTSTGITPAQQFTVINYTYNGGFSSAFYAHAQKAFDEGVFSYEVLEFNPEDQIDLATNGEDVANTLLSTRLGTGEGDVIFVPHIDNPATKIEPIKEGGEVTYQYKHTESFLNGWYMHVVSVDAYLTNLESFLSRYYDENGNLNEQKVKEDFDARCKKNKDKRFRKQAEKEKGRADEIARVQKYRTALLEFREFLDLGLIELVPMQITGLGGTIINSGNYAVNLCPNKDTMGNLKDVAYYNIATEDGTKQSAENMCVMFFDLEDVEDSFEFESLLYINSVIKTARTDITANEK